MSINRRLLDDLIFKNYDRNVVRFIQNSPIYPSVWLAYANTDRTESIFSFRVDLILTPHNKSSAAALFRELQRMGKRHLNDWELATNGETVATKLTFSELVRMALPLTPWWKKLWDKSERTTRELEWLRLVVGAIVRAEREDNIESLDKKTKDFLSEVGREFLGELSPKKPEDTDLLWSVSLNRKASVSLTYSVPCTKADSGRRLFEIDGADITWAVVDSGIDAQHPAFRKIDNKTKKIFLDPMTNEADSFSSNCTRIIATYDFTGFRKLISALASKSRTPRLLTNLPTSDRENKSLDIKKQEESLESIELALTEGRMLDWTVLAPLLRIPHNKKKYKAPKHPHGTHVAGIIGAGLTPEVSIYPHYSVVGMCPCINLYDFRVLDENGFGDEFNIIAALQFIRWINQHEGMNIHGINLSMSLLHDVETYACGQTPVCVSANRLVAEGFVVVAAAGNHGQSLYQSDKGVASQGFRTVNITDPGNAEDVITVGATHRNEPHRYGVSYFSSKGPTGDGRLKPDIVAPGEKIYSSVLNDGVDVMDGTSMAAPHVSGAAALILAKHRELIGRPRKIKDILCKTATDLGRERYFQGFGMVDVLRALQSV